MCAPACVRIRISIVIFVGEIIIFTLGAVRIVRRGFIKIVVFVYFRFPRYRRIRITRKNQRAAYSVLGSERKLRTDAGLRTESTVP